MTSLAYPAKTCKMRFENVARAVNIVGSDAQATGIHELGAKASESQREPAQVRVRVHRSSSLLGGSRMGLVYRRIGQGVLDAVIAQSTGKLSKSFAASFQYLHMPAACAVFD
jgi:hypothetical protein